MTEGSKVERLYAISMKSAQLIQPKHAFLSWKCPKCDTKLNKESVRERIFVDKEGNEFAKRVGADAKLASGIYDLRISHFTCEKCGYEFAKTEIEPFEDKG